MGVECHVEQHSPVLSWNRRNTVVLPLLASCAGGVAGMFGLGGGIVKVRTGCCHMTTAVLCASTFGIPVGSPSVGSNCVCTFFS